MGRENLNFSRFWICCPHKDIMLGVIISLRNSSVIVSDSTVKKQKKEGEWSFNT